MAKCPFQAAMFPFDEQTCELIYRSQDYNSTYMSVWNVGDDAMAIANYAPHTEYELVAFNVTDIEIANETERVNGEGWWTRGVRVQIVLRRKATYYTVIFVLPCILITAIALMGMFTPTTKSQERSEKCTMGLTSLLTIAVILLMVADMVPKSNSHEFPVLGVLLKA